MYSPYATREQGFTLLEMLIVIAIIAIVATIAVPSMQQARLNAAKRAHQDAIINALKEARAQAMINHQPVWFVRAKKGSNVQYQVRAMKPAAAGAAATGDFDLSYSSVAPSFGSVVDVYIKSTELSLPAPAKMGAIELNAEGSGTASTAKATAANFMVMPNGVLAFPTHADPTQSPTTTNVTLYFCDAKKGGETVQGISFNRNTTARKNPDTYACPVVS